MIAGSDWLILACIVIAISFVLWVFVQIVRGKC